ncbi:RagB/SusD family nutrient uptake outer membrane protein [Thalassobellus citreus]|uniref:RagB/SusD family nutrient uptake outer membrane protein n=1 Tax=Thalassobellus citreus TaxID=3367752 RepID=UPI0037AA1548
MKINNKISKGIINVILVIITFSCNEDFLEKNPLDSLSSETFWQTEEQVITGLAGVYANLTENFLGYERVYFECLSDNASNAITNFEQQNLYEMTIGALNAGSGEALENMYKQPYKVITASNYFLDNADNALADPLLTESELNIYKAEVRFLRALAYFDIVQLWGDAPLYTTFPKSLKDIQVPKSNASEIYQVIEDDLNFAISNLPDITYSGHAVKGSAQGLLGKVLLTQEKWADAADVLKTLIDDGKFQLANSYKDIFLRGGQSDPGVNREILFSTKYSAIDVHRISPVQAGLYLELGQQYYIQPFADLADAYQMSNGEDPSSTSLPSANYANRDPRLDMTVKLPGESWPNDVPLFSSFTGFVMEKYVDLNLLPLTPDDAFESYNDLVYLRYADVLLMYSEAKNEVSGPDESVYKALDDVRGRTGVNMPAVDQGIYSDQSSLREFIRNERRVELALEGHRYFDLKRWKIAKSKLDGMPTTNGNVMVFKDYNYKFPFSQSELDANPELDQNEGYLTGSN